MQVAQLAPRHRPRTYICILVLAGGQVNGVSFSSFPTWLCEIPGAEMKVNVTGSNGPQLCF